MTSHRDLGPRLRTAIEKLRSVATLAVIDAEVGAPLEEAELAEVEARLGFSLDPRFVDCFRSANGLRVSWVGIGKPKKGAPPPSRDEAIALWVKHRLTGGPWGAVHVPRLRDVFTASRPNEIGAGTEGARVPILGGWSDVELRSRLRIFDRWEYLLPPGEGGFEHVTVVASEKLADPVVLRASDHGAALSDHTPMRARSYLELMATTLGNQRRWDFLSPRGAPGDHPIVEITADDLGPVPNIDDPADSDASNFAAAHVGYALGRAGLGEVVPRPQRWIGETFPKKVAPRVRAVLESKGHAVSDASGGWVAVVRDANDDVVVRVELYGKSLGLRWRTGAPDELVAALRSAAG